MQVDGVKNPKVQSVFFDDMPVHRAAFANDGAQVRQSGSGPCQGLEWELLLTLGLGGGQGWG